MWTHLQSKSLTSYRDSAEHNRVVTRFAVLARYFRLWNHRAYGNLFAEEDEIPYWLEKLPYIRAALPPLPKAGDAPEHRGVDAARAELMWDMMNTENSVCGARSLHSIISMSYRKSGLSLP